MTARASGATGDRVRPGRDAPGWRPSVRSCSRSPSARRPRGPAAAYNPDSPHWSHINVANLGRGVKYLPAGPVRQAGYEWFARHVDLMEVGMDNFLYTYPDTQSTVMKALNPTFKTFGYDYDLTLSQSIPALGALPEDHFLHFSEDTRLRFLAGDGTLVDSFTVRGCPDRTAATPGCRVQVYAYQFARWVPDMRNTRWRTWYADHLLDEMAHDRSNRPNPVDMVFLDEHRPGFSSAMAIGEQTVIVSGGGIREYGGLVPRDARTPRTNTLDALYNADVVDWLTYLQSRLAPAGKSILVNTAEYFMDPLGYSQSLAAKGVYTELLQSPISFTGGAPHYQRFIDQVHQMTSTGGVVDLAYTGCYQVPANFSAGNYATALDRFKMWNLASYYMVRESPGETGRAYFDPNLCINLNSADPLDFRNDWLAAYEVDVGSPVDQASVYQHGPQSCTGYEYNVFVRHYTNALVLVRPRGDFNCTDYGDATAVDVALPSPMVMLEPDGTLSAPMSAVAIRNGEAVIFVSPDTTPPAPIIDLKKQ